MQKETTRMISFSPVDEARFRAAYKKAKEEKLDSFRFKQHEWVTDYAKYVLEYLDMQKK
jgi:hypothetical protein